MLQGFRNHKRWMMAVIIGPISIAFVATGIYSYSRSNNQENALAEVDSGSSVFSISKSEITQEQFDQYKREQLDDLRQKMGSAFKSDILDNQEARAALLDRMLSERTLSAEVRKEGILISKEQAIEIIKSAGSFQVNGQFDPELYKRFLASQGKTDEGFVQELRQSLAQSVVMNTVSGTPVIADADVTQLNRLLRERREVRVLGFPAADYLNRASVSEEEAKTYYEAHKSEFRTPEALKVQYVVLSPENVESAKPTEDDVRTYYEQNKAKFASAEERHVRHILIAFGGNEAEASKKAQALADQLKKDPSGFAEAAKKESADTGSAAEGGDLGWFGKGVMVPAFETAAFGAAKNAVVGPVRTEYGFHIIQVLDTRGGETPSFEAVRGRIEKEYAQQMAQQKYAETADAFSNMVYEQSDSLQPVMDRYSLKAVTVDGVTKKGTDNAEAAKYLNAHMIDLLFSTESLEEKRNTQAIEVAPNVLVAARVLERTPESDIPFDQVKSGIETRLKNEKAAAIAQEAGEKKLAELKASSSEAGFSAPRWVSRQQPMGQPKELVEAELRIPEKDLPAYAGVKIEGGYVIAQVTKSELPAVTEDEKAAARRELAEVRRAAEANAYVGALKTAFGAKVKNADYEYPKKTQEKK